MRPPRRQTQRVYSIKFSKLEIDALSSVAKTYVDALAYQGRQLPPAIALNLCNALMKMKDAVENKSPIVVLT